MLVIQKGTFVPQVINILTAKDLSWNAEKASMRENVKKEYTEAQTSLQGCFWGAGCWSLAGHKTQPK